MRIALLGLVTVMACGESHAPAEGADAGSGAVLADAAALPLADATYAAGEAGADAVHTDLCSAAVQRAGYVEYTLPLADFCEMLAKDGRGTCPANRAAAVQASVDCSKPGAFPVLRRDCGADRLFMSHPTLYYVGWTFDPATGDLIAARVSGTELACGRGTYLAGPQDVRCDAPSVECHLCEGGPSVTPPVLPTWSLRCPARAARPRTWPRAVRARIRLVPSNSFRRPARHVERPPPVRNVRQERAGPSVCAQSMAFLAGSCSAASEAGITGRCARRSG